MKGERWGCQAVQQSDQKHCAACGLTWDMNDDDPPDCRQGNKTLKKKDVESNAARAKRNLTKIRSMLNAS